MAKKLILGLLAGGAVLGLKQLKQKFGAPIIPSVDQDTVLLFQFDYSPFCIKVRHLLEYKGIPYQTVELTPILHKDFSRQFSGQVKVPYIQHRGRVLVDSSRIALYLEELKPLPSYLPEDPVLREQALLLEDWLDEAFEPCLGELSYLAVARNPQPLIDDPSITTGITALDQYKTQLVPLIIRMNLRSNNLSQADRPRLELRAEEVLQRLRALMGDKKYLVGEQLSLADITLFSMLSMVEKVPELIQELNLGWLIDWKAQIQPELQNQTKDEQLPSLTA